MPSRSQTKSVLLKQGNVQPSLSAVMALLSGGITWLPCNEASGAYTRNALSQFYGNPGADLFGGAGAFASGTGWTPTTPPWSIGSGVATYDDTIIGNLLWDADLGILIGDTLRFRFTIAGNNSEMLFRNGSSAAIIANAAYAIGSHDFQIVSPVAVSTNMQTRGNTTSAGVFTLDNYIINKTGETDGVVTNITFGQNGQYDAASAVSFNGTDSVIALQRTTLNGMTASSIWLRVFFDTLTTNDYLVFKQDDIEVFLASGNGDITVRLHYVTTDAVVTTNTGFVGTSGWHNLFIQWNDTSKTPQIYDGATEATYASTTAGEGTKVTNTNALQIGKNAGTGAFDGLLDEHRIGSAELTQSERQELAAAA